MTKYTALLLNGGVGQRIQAGQPKQLIEVRGTPLMAFSLRIIDEIDCVDQIVLNAPIGYEADVREIVDSLNLQTPIDFVQAGSTRQASVYNMLDLVKNERILLHETARPLVEATDFTKLIESDFDNVSTASPLAFTAAVVDSERGVFTDYINRDQLRNVQLPQKYLLADFLEAHAAAKTEGKEYTEDGTMLTVYGKTVHYVEGTERNFKVTSKLDVELATYLLEQS